MGPTASGKTALAIALNDRRPCEIISVDSAMIYRGMDIGTAKPTLEELRRAPHHLLDICDPLETYSVAQFRTDAIQHIEQAHAQGKLPVLVGGTMMYFKALLDGLSPLPSANPAIRAELESIILLQGLAGLHAELKQVDPIAAEKIHPHDKQRLIRALEVFRITKEPWSELIKVKDLCLPYRFKQFAITPLDRAVLHQRIEVRFLEMLQQGFVDEVAALMQRGDLHLDLPSMRCVGYRQCWQYLMGEYTEAEMQLKGIAATRQLAKRQLTWLRSWPHLTWLQSEKINNIDILLNEII
jgi:tRNA dimethylallyltransferase